MCGIVGYLGPDADGHQRVHLGIGAINHRGPDQSSVIRSGDVSLATARLAIIDRKGGSQPMETPDAQIAVSFNGEIYNYWELRRDLEERGHRFGSDSDTEVLLHLYREFGAEMARHIRGMFAFAIHDRPAGRVLLGRDVFGKKPLYILPVGAGLWFASEIKALRAAATCTFTISSQAVYDYLSLGYVPQPSTIYSEVTALPPGSTASWKGGRLAEPERFWQPMFTGTTPISVADAAARTRELINAAVSRRLEAEVPLGVFLSGGIDSSVIAYEAAQVLGSELQTFTVATGDPALDESAVAARTAQSLHVKNEVLPLRFDVAQAVYEIAQQYDQPFADSSAIPSMAIARRAHEHVTVILNGDGGDELFGGYRRHLAAIWHERLRGMAPALRTLSADRPRGAADRRSAMGLAGRFVRGAVLEPGERYLVFTDDLLRECDREEIWVGDPSVLPTERLVEHNPGLTHQQNQIANDLALNLPSDLLVKIDVACMASSIEPRSPLLDQDLADFALGLPDTMRTRRGTTKWLLRTAYRDVLPNEVIQAPKRGFEVPLGQWLEGDLARLVQDHALAADARITNYLSADAIANIFCGERYADRNLARLRYALVMLETWLRNHA